MNYYEELLETGVPDTIPQDGFTFEDMFDEFVADNPKSWPQDRRLTVGASECFACIRKTWFTKQGHLYNVKEDAEFEVSHGAMTRGNLLENFLVVPAVTQGLKRRGMEIIMAGEGQDTIIDGVHSATLDGLIINAPRDLLSYYGLEDMLSDCCVLEMKSFDPRLSLQYAKPVHEGQTQMQMGLVRQTTKYKPEFAVLLYVNASWVDDIRIFIVPYDENVYQIGRARNEKVFASKEAAELQAEGKMDGSCDYCAFTNACSNASVNRVPTQQKTLTKKQIDDQDGQLLHALDPLVTERLQWKEQEKEATKNVKNLNEQIQQYLITHGKSRAVGDDWKISYSTQKGKKTIDKGKMIEAGLNPEDFMSEGNGFEKLTVTVAKQ